MEFERLLTSIFGAEFIETFRLKRSAGWVDLMAAFESRKRTASPFKSTPLNVALPFSFIDYHKKCRVCTELPVLFIIMSPSLIGGALSDALSDVCLSVAYIGPKSRTERPRKTKIGTEVTHVTRDSNITFKVKRSKVKVTRPLYSARP